MKRPASDETITGEPQLKSQKICGLLRRSSTPQDWPPLIERRWEPSKPSDPSAGSIRALSFNLLADGKQSEEDWECTSDVLDWGNRKFRIVEELCTHEPDVLLLQEVDAKHFSAFFETQLGPFGYRGAFEQMPAPRPDGVAVFWKEEKFSCASKIPIEYKANKEVALAVILEALPGVCKSQPLKEVCAVSTHLKSGKEQKDEELREAQVAELLELLQQRASALPIVIGADMNAEPHISAKAVSALAVPKLLKHPRIKFESAYAVEFEKDSAISQGNASSTTSSADKLERKPSIDYTTWKRRPGGEVRRVIDYLFYTADSLEPTSLLALPVGDEVPGDRFPAKSYPSDHVSLGADLQCRL
jgi:mRNA deadenylase 3'-5' endonuclease subunit Ccr4